MTGGPDLLARSCQDRVGKPASDWIAALGIAGFKSAQRVDLLEGPSGPVLAQCRRCAQAGHTAPAFRKKGSDEYVLYCQAAGVYTAPASDVETFTVSQSRLFALASQAFRIPAEPNEYRSLGGGLYFLGTARLNRPFSVIAAMQVRTKDELQDLVRRNREGFAKEAGLILCSDDLWMTGEEKGLHACSSWNEVLDWTPDGFTVRWGEVRRRLGLPGRPEDRESQSAAAQYEFEAILAEYGQIPIGQKGFSLLKERRPELADLSGSSLYAAKAAALKNHRARNKASSLGQ